jgi:hypothetical protein
MTARNMDPRERFMLKVVKADSGCWEWTGADRGGYGRFHLRPGRVVAAHRFAYETFVGQIPVGLEIDHLCRNRGCVNPIHLEPVDHAENRRRARLTHCRRGHLFDNANTYTHASGKRYCRACNVEHQRKFQARRRQQERTAA